jgi:RNA polymerase sigma factor (sigma-70 family)
MSEERGFAELIRRIRAGDAEASAELVRRYEGAIRRQARLRLGADLRGLLDSMDVCQSVLKSFFVRVASGQFRLETPEQLLKLLVTMARNKVREEARRAIAGDRSAEEPFDPGPSPSESLIVEDLLEEVRRRLTAEEREMWERRRRGGSWDEIAQDLGGTAVARRKQYSRAMDRVTRELGLEEE